jgi:hypothetical protein
VLLFQGGPRFTTLLQLNLDGPAQSTLRRGLREGRSVLSRIHLDTVKAAVQLLSKIMQKRGISPGTVISQASEDETAVIAEVRWNQGLDALIGFCGKVGDNHKCEAGGVVVQLGGVNGVGTVYEQILSAFKENRIGWYGRVIMINPLYEGLPSIPVLFQSTCNRFDADFVRQQWNELCRYWREAGLEKVGMLIGHASDGDARRRKLMLEDYTRALPPDRCFTLPNCPSFTLVAHIDQIEGVSGIHSQDSIHNGKKGINPLDSPHRCLLLGKHMVTIQHLHAVYKAFKPSEHGMQLDDIERKDRQNWAACQRLMFRKPRKCLDVMAGSSQHRYLATQGTSAYLEVSSHYRQQAI